MYQYVLLYTTLALAALWYTRPLGGTSHKKVGNHCCKPYAALTSGLTLHTPASDTDSCIISELNGACAGHTVKLLRVEDRDVADKTMDISALPNTNQPERFLQLDVGMLPATHGMFQLQAAMSSQRHWHNRVYNQVMSRLFSHVHILTNLMVIHTFCQSINLYL